MIFLYFLDQPLPEGERLGMGIIDTKYAYTLLDPEENNAF